MFKIKEIFLFLLFQCTACLLFAQQPDLKLWYKQPAGTVWEQALPIGNGRLAAMVYGNPVHEQIQLNESSVWSGGPNRNDGPEALQVLPEVRRLIFEGKHKEAAALAEKKIKSSKINGMQFQPVGSLNIDFEGHEEYAGYKRQLDLESALASATYMAKGVAFSENVFASIPDQIIMVRLRAEKFRNLTFTLSLRSPQHSSVRVLNGNELSLSGISSDHDGVKGSVKFNTLARLEIAGGSITSTDSTIHVSKASEAVIYLSIGTNFINYNKLGAGENIKADSVLERALHYSFQDLLKRNKAVYGPYFSRMHLDLGSTDSAKKPSDVRLNEFSRANDPQLVTLYFQYGRYLLISCSQPGGQPANLQGIWNNKMDPPWGSKYTININTEMNYWPAEETNLSEMHEPLVHMIMDLSLTGRETAWNMYHAKGWLAHHNTDLWRITGPVDGVYSGMWPMGGVWLSRHLWERYLFTGDKTYLASVYPALKGAAEFCLSFLIEEPEHKWLVISPSLSPENNAAVFPGTSIDAGTTLDNQLVFELFSNVIRAAALLGRDQSFSDSLYAARKRLPPMQVGQYSQLQEWMHDLDTPNDKNRHVSHLFGLYPSNQISVFHTPELADAARHSLIYRSDVSTGWSMGWKVNLWARLHDGEHAFKLIRNQLTPAGLNKGSENSGGGTYPNFFDAHPPFQIDGNFGCTAGIAEMLVQSQDGFIELLPALPDALNTGNLQGMKARGGFEISDMAWKDGKLITVSIRSALGGNCRIRVPNTLKGNEGLTLSVAAGENKNPFFLLNAITPPVFSKKASLHPLKLKKTIVYDFPTKAGELYHLSAR